MWKQLINFNVKKMGKKSGYCLQNVRLGFGIPAKHGDALEDMRSNANAGTLHNINSLPDNVAVPVYVDTPNVHEHIIVSDKGIFYSDGKKISRNTYDKYFRLG